MSLNMFPQRPWCSSNVSTNFASIDTVISIHLLNYFLFKLCGPSRKDLKVADFEKVEFDPGELVATISKIYINLQDVDEFCKKVGNR